MNTKQKHILVLSFNEDTVAVAQASLESNGYEIKHTATCPMDSTMTWDDPDGFGHSLRRFLKQEHMNAKSVLVGVPARWVVAKTVQIPPTKKENVPSLLQIQTEQAFSLNHHDLVFDYSARISETEPNKVLLAAMQRNRLDKISALAKAAGLHLISVTPSVAAMGVLSNGHATTCGVYAQNEHCEMVLASNGVVNQIKHMATPLNNKDPKSMAEDIQRLMLLAGTRTSEVVVWSDGSNPTETVSYLRQSLAGSADVKVGREALTQTGRLHLGQTSSEYDGPLSMVAALDRPEAQLIDFLNSHMVVKVTDHKPRIMVWSAVAALIVIIGIMSLFYGLYQDQQVIKACEQKLEENAQVYDAVLAIRNNLSATAPWYTTRPQFLSSMNDVVSAFPDEGNIWVSSFILKQNGEGSISGEAVNSLAVIDVLDKLNALDTISDATPVGAIGTNRSDYASFSIRFNFKSE